MAYERAKDKKPTTIGLELVEKLFCERKRGAKLEKVEFNVGVWHICGD